MATTQEEVTMVMEDIMVEVDTIVKIDISTIPRRRPRCWIFHKENHLNTDWPYKDRINLKFCNTCKVRDHSLWDYPILLEKSIDKKSVNSLSCVPKSNVQCAKNLQVITRCGTRTGFDKNTIEPIKHIENNDYLNCQTQKELFKDAEFFFEEMTANEDKE